MSAKELLKTLIELATSMGYTGDELKQLKLILKQTHEGKNNIFQATLLSVICHIVIGTCCSEQQVLQLFNESEQFCVDIFIV